MRWEKNNKSGHEEETHIGGLGGGGRDGAAASFRKHSHPAP